MHLTLETLLREEKFSEAIREMVAASGRNEWQLAMDCSGP
jgi:hypothetical protein